MTALATLVITAGLMVSSPPMEPIGVYEITAYAGDGITATGTVPVPYRTVAVDPQVIPLGTTLYIDGIGAVVAEDVGGAVVGRVLDIYLPGTEADTVSWGRQERMVWIVQ